MGVLLRKDCYNGEEEIEVIVKLKVKKIAQYPSYDEVDGVDSMIRDEYECFPRDTEILINGKEFPNIKSVDIFISGEAMAAITMERLELFEEKETL